VSTCLLKDLGMLRWLKTPRGVDLRLDEGIGCKDTNFYKLFWREVPTMSYFHVSFRSIESSMFRQ
jgi:cytochrome bd-type quinol oxidase subunit 1